jgi:hypothetical protein
LPRGKLRVCGQRLSLVPHPTAPNPNIPPGLNGPQATGPDKKAIDWQNQQGIRADASKLYERVAALLEQIDKSDSTSTFSVSVVKKAQQIEKLAKQIKDLAKG